MVRTKLPNPSSAPPQTNQKEKNKLDQLTQNSSQILFQAKTVFPFDFIPTEIIIDITKISIIQHGPFGVTNTHSVHIPDITDVTVGSSTFLSGLEIHIGQTPQFIKVPNLRHQDAQKIHRLVQGLIIATKEQIDLSQFTNLVDLTRHLETLGNPKV